MPQNIIQSIRPPNRVFHNDIPHPSQQRGNPYSQDTRELAGLGIERRSLPLVNSINGLTSKKEEVMLSALAIDTEANAKRRQRHLKVTQTSLTLAILH
eukprot:scaffold2058_cov168-Chaetoceros_neogracile.AAC.2